MRRHCPTCHGSLNDRRADAVYCSPPCRAEASRRRRLRDGRTVDGYADLASYGARQRRTNLQSGGELRWPLPSIAIKGFQR